MSRILRLSGFNVYDCDFEARRLMESDATIKLRIHNEVSAEATDGKSIPDRKVLANLVFSNENARLRLNSIVHDAVRRDVMARAATGILLFVESAILAESGLADECCRIWKVEAPQKLRISRTTCRDNCPQETILARMESQRKEESLLTAYEDKTDIIINDGSLSLLAQIKSLLRNLKIDIISEASGN